MDSIIKNGTPKLSDQEKREKVNKQRRDARANKSFAQTEEDAANRREIYINKSEEQRETYAANKKELYSNKSEEQKETKAFLRKKKSNNNKSDHTERLKIEKNAKDSERQRNWRLKQDDRKLKEIRDRESERKRSLSASRIAFQQTGSAHMSDVEAQLFNEFYEKSIDIDGAHDPAAGKPFDSYVFKNTAEHLSVKHLVNGMCGVCDLQCAKSDLTYSKISKIFIKVL